MQILYCYYLPCHFGRAPSRLLGPLRLFLRGFLSPACLLLSFRLWEIPLHHFYLASGCGTFSDPSLGKGCFSFPRMVHSLGLSHRYNVSPGRGPFPGSRRLRISLVTAPYPWCYRFATRPYLPISLI